ncbi:inactive serine protease PAMR1 [Haplochromis burtoni]|uniref:inactive serine protease PAMR1 n=1 Tax=Haplochromis burtoni TaxID=8153 RepID=UPI001C2D960C|nr:inactive serine protease PAMR1 [Haplochromis burtoni]
MQQRTCLPNGTWSGTAPSCVKGPTSLVRCAPPPKLLHGYHRPALDSAGGAETIEFFCKTSYILSGNHQSTCLSNGSWSSRSPKCVRVCREPRVSELVRQSVVKPHLLLRQRSDQTHLSSRYSMDDLLSAGFIPLTSGGLSREKNDDTSLAEIPRGFHPVYTSIDYKCASPLYRNKGSSRRTCLKTGRWSGHYVSCSPVCGKFDAFSRHNLSDAQWPWHAAIYIRSPPDHTVSTYTSPGRIITDQQGASEESTFWFLACSGALVAQHRVLVVAQCVVDKNKQQHIQPEHVKVVIGKQYHTPRDVLKSQHHLRVSEIVVHPNFFSSPDSDVAVLKLKDKAKIRERVLPVCLPKTQGGEVTAQEAYTARWILPSNPRHLGHSATLSLTKLVELTDVTHCEREFAQGGAHTTAISDNSLCVISKPSSPQSACPIVIPGITTMPAVFSSTRAVLSGHEDTHRASSAGWQLLGLERATSFEKNNCNQPSYTVHTQIANFQDWIEQHVK